MNNTLLCWVIAVPTATVILTALDKHRLALQLHAKLDQWLEKDFGTGLSPESDSDIRKDNLPAAITHPAMESYDTRPHEEFRTLRNTKTK